MIAKSARNSTREYQSVILDEMVQGAFILKMLDDGR
jgi:hypothetical protein